MRRRVRGKRNGEELRRRERRSKGVKEEGGEVSG